MTKKELLKEIVAFYSGSSDANGLPVRQLVHADGASIKTLRRQIIELVAEGSVEVVFAETDENPYIRRLPRNLRKPFHQLVESCNLEEACLYPIGASITKSVDLSRWKNEPYALRLWSGDSHLDLVFFDLAVLERYRNDPRYLYTQDYFGGSIYLKTEHYLDDDFAARDKILLQRFGIGYDPNSRWVVGVILRDLVSLSADHQGIWRGYELTAQCRLNEASFRTWFFGEWLEYNSVFSALTEEISVINAMTQAAFGKPLFNQAYETGTPNEYGVLLRPTEKEFLNFARTLDLMLSENVNQDFFPSSVSRTQVEKQKDGTEKTIPKGTIRLLKDWVDSAVRVPTGDPGKEISAPLQRVRGLRSKASHRQIEDGFDYTYEQKQRDLIRDAYGALRTLRLLLANHPKSKSVEVPEWLFNGDIRIP